MAKAKRFRATKASQALARARAILGKRSSGLSAPVRTGGFYGVGSYRGRTELKAIDTNPTLTPIANNGSLQLINGIATGTDYTDRTGRKIMLKSLLGRIFIYPSITLSSENGTTTRCLIVYDSQTNGTAPAVTDILNVPTYDPPIVTGKQIGRAHV